MDETGSIFTIISFIVLILFFVLVNDVNSIKKNLKELKKMASESLKNVDVIREGKCPHCDAPYSTYKKNGEIAKCKVCRKEFEILI